MSSKPSAKTLRQLFAIREHNQDLLDEITTLGTALGLKNGDGEPAILVFVDQKIGGPWLRADQKIPSTLEDDRHQCPTDVVSGDSARDLLVQVFDRWEANPTFRPLQELVATDPLEPRKIELRDRLRGNTERLTPGCQVSFRDAHGHPLDGTLACFAREPTTGRVGFLTNRHIGGFDGNRLFFPSVEHQPVGVVGNGVLVEELGARYGHHTGSSSWPAKVRVDAGFCRLHPDIDAKKQISRELPLPDGTSVKLGPPLPLDLDSMGAVGEKVVGVGRTRSWQKGRIFAFAFEYLDQENGYREYCDYLIVGDDGVEFSDPGDSGKLVVTEENYAPVAIMWGGEWARRRHGMDLENWTNATDISLTLDRLNVELLR